MRRIASALLTVALLACSSDPPTSPPAPAPTRSTASRETEPRIEPAEREAFVAGEAAFAADVFHAVVQDANDQNLFVSPHGIWSAFAMLYAGARGETAAQIRRVLHYDLPDDRLHAAFDATNLVLDRRDDLHVANAVFALTGYPFEQPYVDTLARWYGATPTSLPFATAPEDARNSINAWAAEQTSQRILEVLPAGAVGTNTRLVLANAVYLDATWETPFTKNLTQPAAFTDLDGRRSTVQMMHGAEQRARHLRAEDYEAVALPYRGGSMEMLVVVPDLGKFREVRDRLTGAELAALPERLQDERLIVSMPKFQAAKGTSLAKPLASLGLTLPFEAGADFRGIATGEGLRVDDATHVAWVSVDEEGTEAAAVTTVSVGGPTGGIGGPLHVDVDRSFLAAVVERQTGAILFFGQILAPDPS